MGITAWEQIEFDPMLHRHRLRLDHASW